MREPSPVVALYVLFLSAQGGGRRALAHPKESDFRAATVTASELPRPPSMLPVDCEHRHALLPSVERRAFSSVAFFFS